MSNTDGNDQPSSASDASIHTPVQRLNSRESTLGEGLKIRRALPNRQRRTIGAWCFLDHAGPKDVSNGSGIRVGPHPHIGLQTFTWMMEGELLHRDSLGNQQLIKPGQVNLMTAGHGISHSEESPQQRSARVHLAQLWIALPADQADIAPAFKHYPKLPTITDSQFSATVLVGSAFGQTSPVTVHSPLMAVDLVINKAGKAEIELHPAFEHGAIVLQGEATLAGEPLKAGELLYFGCGRPMLEIQANEGAHILLIGGEPFTDSLQLWWNFVGRSKADVGQATADWQHGNRFGEVAGYEGKPLEAPDIPWQPAAD